MQECSANQYQVIMPSWLPKVPSWLRKNVLCLSQSAFSNFAPYVISIVSAKDETNTALWLATRASKRASSCPLKNTHCVPRKKNCYFISVFLYWPIAGYWSRSSLMCLYMDLVCISVHKHAKNELDRYPAILISRFVNNHAHVFSIHTVSVTEKLMY